MNRWHKYGEGKSINEDMVEDNVILRDDEHQLDARITFKRSRDFLSISGHVYGWEDHTRFFATISEAEREYVSIKKALGTVMNMIEKTDSKDIKVWEAISEFIRRFP